MGSQNDLDQGAGAEPGSAGAQRDAGAERRIDQRRQHDKDIARREEEGYDQPESSAQKSPPEGPQP